jgi:hypothetical protein
MTQPLMYNLIEAKRSVRKLYTEALIGRGDISVEEAEQALRDYQGQLERVFTETRETPEPSVRTDVTAGLDLPLAQQQDDEDAAAAAHRRRPRRPQADRRRARLPARGLLRAPEAPGDAGAPGGDGDRGRQSTGRSASCWRTGRC